jgi:phospholipid/cholesterol/gamma-HCH transport system substrate-binding protein
VSSKARTLKVGVFVFFAIVLATIAVFVIGDNRRVWDSKVTYYVAYDDVLGIKPGSVVRMGGLDIGSVSDVKHKEDAKDSRVYVTLSVAREEKERIRRATIATIESKGLLGDKMVQLSFDPKLAKEMREARAKDPSKEDPDEVLPPNDPKQPLKGATPSDLIGDAAKAAREAKLAAENIQKATQSIADDKFKEDVQGTAHALREITEAIAHGDGAAHRLLYDKEEAARIDRILANLEVTSGNLARVSADARDVSGRVKSGPGLAHTIVYDDQLAQGTTGAIVELHRSLTALRTGNGIGHVVIYGDENTQHLMGNMNAISDDLREIVANVKAGRGTIGALLVDPTVYEDVKSLVGNVERNQVLRALVRYSIKQNEEKPHAEVKPDAPHPAVTPSPQRAGK